VPDMPLLPGSGRTQALSTLAGNVSSQIGQEAQAQQAARLGGLQNAVQQAAAGGAKATAGQIQATGAQQTQAAGQIGLQLATSGQTRMGQVGAMGLQEQYMQTQQELSNRKLTLDKQNQAQVDKLATLSLGLKTELMDKQMTFAQDAMGRTLFNERQLMDWQVQKAQSHEDLLNYEQQVNQMSQLRLNMLSQAKSVLESSMKNASEQWNQALDDQQKQALAKAVQDLQKKIQQERAKQANRAAQFEAVGTVIGGVIGAVVGGPPGAMAGAAVGGGLGGIAASQTS
jgi:hypothetical protein